MSQIDNLKFLGDVDVAGNLTNRNKKVLTSEDLVSPDWNQNDETAPDYVKNRTHYVENSREEIEIHLGTKECSGFTIDTSMPVIAGKTAYQSTLPQGEEDPYFNYGDYPIGSKFRLEIKQSNDCIFSQILTWHEEGAGNTNPDTGGWTDESAIGNADLTGPEYSFGTLNTGELASIYTNDTDQYVSFYLDDTIQLSPDSVITISLYYLDSIEKVVQLDEKFIPEIIARKDWVTEEIEDSSETLVQIIESTNDSITDILTELDKLSSIKALVKDLEPIDLLAKLNIQGQSVHDYPLTDLEFITLLQNKIQNYTQEELFNLFDYFYNKYNNLKIMPVFKIVPGEQVNSSRYTRLCSTLRVELDSIKPENESTIDPEFDLKYYIDLSNNTVLKINFNYILNEDGTTSEIPWNNLNSSNGIMTITFELLPKSSWL